MIFFPKIGFGSHDESKNILYLYRGCHQLKVNKGCHSWPRPGIHENKEINKIESITQWSKITEAARYTAARKFLAILS